MGPADEADGEQARGTQQSPGFSSSTCLPAFQQNRPVLNVEIYDDLEAKKETRFFKRGSCLVLKKFRLFQKSLLEAYASSHKTCNSGVNGPSQCYKNPQ